MSGQQNRVDAHSKTKLMLRKVADELMKIYRAQIYEMFPPIDPWPVIPYQPTERWGPSPMERALPAVKEASCIASKVSVIV